MDLGFSFLSLWAAGLRPVSPGGRGGGCGRGCRTAGQWGCDPSPPGQREWRLQEEEGCQGLLRGNCRPIPEGWS